jgi:hypothetical protein
MLANEIGNVWAARDNAKMIGAGEVERKARKFSGQALALERPRHFRVKKNDEIGETPIRKDGAKTIDEHFETFRRFVVGDGCVVEIHAHGPPCGFARFAVIPPLMQAFFDSPMMTSA